MDQRFAIKDYFHSTVLQHRAYLKNNVRCVDLVSSTQVTSVGSLPRIDCSYSIKWILDK